MPLTIRVTKEDPPVGTVRVRPAGSLDSVTTPQLETELKIHLAGTAQALILDLAELTFISSAGIRAILAARRQMTDIGGALLIVNTQPPVQKAFEIINAIPGIGIFKDIAELDAYLAIMQRKAGGGAA